MARKGENIYHRKDGRWEGRYKLNGENKYRYIYAHSYSECRKLRNKKIAEAAPESPGKIGFAKICEEWLESKKNTIKISTYSKYNTLINRYFINFFGNGRFSLTAQKLCEYIKFLSDKNLSSKTIWEHFKLLKQIALFASPVNLTAFQEAQKFLPKREKSKVQTISENNRKALEKYIIADMDNNKLGIFLAISLGLRIGEVCALKWSDIDFERKILTVSKTIQRVDNINRKNNESKTKVIITLPKSKAGKREIPLPDKIIKVLKKFKSDNDIYIITGTKKFCEPRSYSNIFHRILRECKIPPVNFHVLRHTFATRFAEIINDYKALSEILGHSSVSITMSYYVHLSDSYKRNRIDLLL